MVRPRKSEEQILCLFKVEINPSLYNSNGAVPVAVSIIVILKDSPSMTCAPELDPVGDKRLVIACMPCNVPARTRYSLAVSWASPSMKDVSICVRKRCI
jgi:hypothetical protein